MLVHYAVIVEVETYATGEEALDACFPEAAAVCLWGNVSIAGDVVQGGMSHRGGGRITADQGKMRNRFKNLRNCT